MRKWFRFFLGSPKRAIVTALCLLAIASSFDQTLPQRLFQRLSVGAEPVISMVIAIAILVAVYRRFLK